MVGCRRRHSSFPNGKSLWKIETCLDNARKLKIQARKYAHLFGLKLPKLPAVPALTQDRRDKLAVFDAGREARSTARYAAKQAIWKEQSRLDALSREEKIAAWRAGSTARFWNLTGDGYALLRVKGSNVETSQGVSVPINGLAGAGRLLRFLTFCKEANRTYQRNGHTEHIGNFTVESFNPAVLEASPDDPTKLEWIMTAGCHRITWTEIESIREAVQTLYKPGPLTTETDPA